MRSLPLLALTFALLPGCVVHVRNSGGGGGDDPPPPSSSTSPPPSSSTSPPPSSSPPPSTKPPSTKPSPEKRDDVLELDARWRPLERIEERPALPGGSTDTATTISPIVYVPDLPAWLKKHPPGTPLFEAVLAHEQVHARRQTAAGVDGWVARYLHDTEFMWAEEQRGWYTQLVTLRQSGLRLDAKAVARTLANTYSNLAGSMVSEAEALKWATAVIEGRWRPAD